MKLENRVKFVLKKINFECISLEIVLDKYSKSIFFENHASYEKVLLYVLCLFSHVE